MESEELNGEWLTGDELSGSFTVSGLLSLPLLTVKAVECLLHAADETEGAEPEKVVAQALDRRLRTWAGPRQPLGTTHEAELALWCVEEIADVADDPLCHELLEGLRGVAVNGRWAVRLTPVIETKVIGDHFDSDLSWKFADPAAEDYFRGLYGLDSDEIKFTFSAQSRNYRAAQMLVLASAAVCGQVDHRDESYPLAGLDRGVLLKAVYQLYELEGLPAAADYIIALDQRLRAAIVQELVLGPKLSELDQASPAATAANTNDLTL